MTRCNHFGIVAIALALPLLQGCAAAFVAMQTVPVAIGGVAMANAEDVSPFRNKIPRSQPIRSDNELAMLDTHLRLAGCGNAESQYWLGSALKNDFNATPDYVEIYKWYRLAELGHFEPAARELAILDAAMPAAEIAEARARAAAWQPTTGNCSVERQSGSDRFD